VSAAPSLRQSGIEIVPTAYLLIDGGRVSTTSYITQTLPIPSEKTEIAVATAIAAEMMGMQVVYLEAGSGAIHPVSADMIAAVRAAVALPIIVGGGIRTPEQAEAATHAGATMVVIGNAVEKSPEILFEISLALH
jgi:putative glycerol-1-phosphate prenyltransferase